MEYSLVAVPSNPEALTQRAKAYGGEAALAALRLDAPSEGLAISQMIDEAFERVNSSLGTAPRPARTPPGDLLALALELAALKGQVLAENHLYDLCPGLKQQWQREIERLFEAPLVKIACEQARVRRVAARLNAWVNRPRTVL